MLRNHWANAIALTVMFLLCSSPINAQSLTSGQCFASGGFCDASNTCISYAPLDTGLLLEQTIGTCESPEILIILPGDPPPPPPLPPFVGFMNNTRSSDRVVSSNDNQMPGGTKELQVMVRPKMKTAQLTISRPLGKAGTAFFDARRTQTVMNVTDGQTITIYGGQTSDMPRNMSITAKIGGQTVPGQFDFTVFRVDAVGIISGTLEQVLPRRVRANSGRRILNSGNATPLPPRTMRTLFQDFVTEANGTITTAPDGKIDKRFMAGQPDLDRVGHRFLDDTLVYGGIVFKGTILPKNIDPSDFSRTLPPNVKGVPPQMRETFNWVRIKFATENVYVNNQFKRNTICINNISDDGTDDE